MFVVKVPLLRIFSDSVRLINHPASALNVTASVKSRTGKFTPRFTRCFSKDKDDNKHFKGELPKEKNEEVIEIFDLEEERKKFYSSGDLSSKYKVFKDEDSTIILDVEEERLVSQSSIGTPVAQQREFDGISLERGVHGVFDVEEIVSILKSKNAEDIVVIQTDPSVGFAHQIVIVSGKSSRHLQALAGFIRRVYKKKMQKGDLVPHVEGKKKSEDWLALDLGNIVLHLFSKSTRAVYDLESLWALGPEFDPCLNQMEDPLAAIINKHSHYLSDLEPADSK